MTAVQTPAARAAVPPLAVRARDVLSSEWTKLRSVRSYLWTLLAAAAVTLGITAVVAQAVASAPRAAGGGPFTPLLASFLGYAEYGVLPVSVLGVLAFTSEYASGQIRTTFTAVPRRWPVLAAKAAAAGAAALIAGELLAFASFFLCQAILARHHQGVSLASPGVPGAVLAAGSLLPACVLLALALGAITRHTAGGVAAMVALIYLLPALCLSLPSPWGLRVGRFTLAFAASQVVSGNPRPGMFSPAVSMLVIIAWPAVALLIAAFLISRRDA